MEEVIEIVKKGGIIIYPTDTAFAIGCRIDNPNAVEKLFALRKRLVTKAVPILVDSIAMALTYFESPPDIVRHLMNSYWPGALTIISRSKKKLAHSPITGFGDTIGLRQPDHKTALTLIGGVGVPIVGTSANFSGKNTPFFYEEIDPELINLVDYTVPGECKIKQVSTVVDCSGANIKIIRQGAITIL